MKRKLVAWKVGVVMIMVLALVAAFGGWAVAGTSSGNQAGGLPELEKRVAALEQMVADMNSSNADLKAMIVQLQAALGAETARAKAAEATLASQLDAQAAQAQASQTGLEASLQGEVSRAKGVEMALAARVKQETWHGYYMQGGVKYGWTAVVTVEDDGSFTGAMAESRDGNTYHANISGQWSNHNISFTKLYTDLHGIPILYTGTVAGGGEVQGTWNLQGGSDAWAMSR